MLVVSSMHSNLLHRPLSLPSVAIATSLCSWQSSSLCKVNKERNKIQIVRLKALILLPTRTSMKLVTWQMNKSSKEDPSRKCFAKTSWRLLLATVKKRNVKNESSTEWIKSMSTLTYFVWYVIKSLLSAISKSMWANYRSTTSVMIPHLSSKDRKQPKKKNSR